MTGAMVEMPPSEPTVASPQSDTDSLDDRADAREKLADRIGADLSVLLLRALADRTYRRRRGRSSP